MRCEITVTTWDSTVRHADVTHATVFRRRGELVIYRNLTSVARYRRGEWTVYAVANSRPADG